MPGKSSTLKRATEIVDEAVAQAETYNVPRAATLRLLARAEGLFDEMARYGRPTPELRYRKAWMLIQFARNYQILGDTGKQFERATEAYALLAGLAAEKPDDKVYQRDLSVAYAEVGDVLVTQGKLSDALRVYRESLAIIERLAIADPGNAGFQFDLAIRHERIGRCPAATGRSCRCSGAVRGEENPHRKSHAARPRQRWLAARSLDRRHQSR